jgi:hypothetical protein
MLQTSCVPENDVMRFLLYRHAWDMAAEICLAQLPMLLCDPNAEFKVISNPSLPSAMWSQFCLFRALMLLLRCDIWYYCPITYSCLHSCTARRNQFA